MPATLNQGNILLNGEEYRLARAEVTAQLPGRPRSYQIERKPVATKREPRPDVRPGEYPGEWVIVWDDWSKGIGGDYENLPGTIHYTTGADPTWPGSLRQMALGSQSVDTSAQGSDPAISVFFNNSNYLVCGTRLFRETGLILNMVRTLSAAATDAVVWNNELIIAEGASGIEAIATNNTIRATGPATAQYLAVVEDVLWRASTTNAISRVTTNTADPTATASWNAAITVGDAVIPITDLNAYGERVAVSKQDGLYLGDEALIFPKVFDALQEPETGQRTLVRGSDLFFPHPHGLIHYNNGSYKEVGPHLSFPSTNTASANLNPHISVMAQDGEYIWAATEPTILPSADPTGVLKEVNPGTTYTDYLATSIDNDMLTGPDLSGLDSTDHFYVGYSAAFYGFTLLMNNPNLLASVLTVEYWSGAAFVAFPVTGPVIDGTARNGVTLNRSGSVMWRALPADWTANTINGSLRFWVRCSVSATLTAVSTVIGEARVITGVPTTFLLRGRNRRADDVRGTSIIWENVAQFQNVNKPTLLCVSTSLTHLGNITIASRQTFDGPYPEIDGTAKASYFGSAGITYLPRHDGGMPEVSKQFIRATLKGRTIGASNTVDLYYRLNDSTGAWTTLASNIATTPSTTEMASVTGYAIQPRIDFDAVSVDTKTEINQLEITFRERPTYKSHYTYVLELADNESGSTGGSLPEANVQWTNLQAALGGAPVNLVDPMMTTDTVKSVMVTGLQLLERVQSGLDYPVVAVELKAVEV